MAIAEEREDGKEQRPVRTLALLICHKDSCKNLPFINNTIQSRFCLQMNLLIKLKGHTIDAYLFERSFSVAVLQVAVLAFRRKIWCAVKNLSKKPEIKIFSRNYK